MTQSALTKPRVCIAGIGGFAHSHHQSALLLESEGRLSLLATCDPRADQLADSIRTLQLTEREVGIFTEFDVMLDSVQADLLTISTPIGLHAPMHEAAVRRGMACYLEKPPTLDPDELEKMIEVDSKAKFQTQVGFVYIVQPARIDLKRRIVAGEFGKVQEVSYEGLWPRTDRYYSRSKWAGRLRMGDALLLDSCFGNAMAHHAHNLLFFAGTTDVMAWAEIANVRAELYRAHPIESPDTIFSEAVTTDGIRLRVALSHASPEKMHSLERIVTDKAIIEIHPGSYMEIHHKTGETEKIGCTFVGSPVTDNLRYYLDYLAGAHPRPLTTLVDSRPFVTWNALLYVACRKITQIIRISERRDEAGRALMIEDIDKATRLFCEESTFPSEAGFKWAVAGGEAVASEASQLSAVVDQLI